MIKIENFEVLGWEHAVRGMRNPMNSHDRSDSSFKEIAATTALEGGKPVQYNVYYDALAIGENDHNLMTSLRKSGPDHRKFMRYLDVCLDITAPLYWWKEFKTYRIGRKFMDEEDFFDYDDELIEMFVETNSCSTMHKIHEKEFTMEDFSCEHLGPPAFKALQNTLKCMNDYREEFLKDHDKHNWWQMIQLLPSSYNQKRTVKLTYEVLARMYKARKKHKLDEWREFCAWIETLPYSEIITGGKNNEKDTHAV